MNKCIQWPDYDSQCVENKVYLFQDLIGKASLIDCSCGGHLHWVFHPAPPATDDSVKQRLVSHLWGRMEDPLTEYDCRSSSCNVWINNKRTSSNRPDNYFTEVYCSHQSFNDMMNNILCVYLKMYNSFVHSVAVWSLQNLASAKLLSTLPCLVDIVNFPPTCLSKDMFTNKKPSYYSSLI